MIRAALLIALAAAGLAPLAAAPSAPTLKPGAAKCAVNGGAPQPCEVRKSEGGMDIEIGGDQPLLAMVVDSGISLFALVGETKERTPLIMDYARDPDHPGCWQAAESDAVVWRLCVR